MFTGIVAEMGEVLATERDGDGARLRIACSFASELSDGDSVAVNGCCLTAVDVTAESFQADVMNQTLDQTSLGPLAIGARVNLEPALRASDRLGGHIVQGHVDGTGQVRSITLDGLARRMAVTIAPKLLRYVVAQGSITLDGVSLTVSRLEADGVEVSLIPETLERTTLGMAKEGSLLNLEMDIVARYVERLVQGFRLKPEGTASDDDE